MTVDAPNKVPDTGYLVTNHLNLMYMIAAGLIMPPSGFGSKYYQDSLNSFPGWIPLHVDKIPQQALDLASKEAGHLFPVIIKIRMSELKGKIPAVSLNNPSRETLLMELEEQSQVHLVPAPLPVSLIDSIVFQSMEEMRKFNTSASELKNAPVGDFQRKVGKTLFARAGSWTWPPKAQVTGLAPMPRAALASGGVMAMLLHLANKGRLLVDAARLSFDPDENQTAARENRFLNYLSNWMNSGVALKRVNSKSKERLHQEELWARLFWGFVDRFLQSEPEKSAEETVLEHLQDELKSVDRKQGADVFCLFEDIRSLFDLGGGTLSELIGRNQSPVARAMILFCVRKDCADLLEFDGQELREQDWLAAAILFGIRSGWLDLPSSLRTIPGLKKGELSDAVTRRMAKMSHRISGSGLDLGPSPPRIQPLRELLGVDAGQEKITSDAALQLCNVMKWDCIKTRVAIPKGDHQITVDGSRVFIEFSGLPQVTTEIDSSHLSDLLAQSSLPSSKEARIRKMFS